MEVFYPLEVLVVRGLQGTWLSDSEADAALKKRSVLVNSVQADDY